MEQRDILSNQQDPVSTDQCKKMKTNYKNYENYFKKYSMLDPAIRYDTEDYIEIVEEPATNIANFIKFHDDYKSKMYNFTETNKRDTSNYVSI